MEGEDRVQGQRIMVCAEAPAVKLVDYVGVVPPDELCPLGERGRAQRLGVCFVRVHQGAAILRVPAVPDGAPRPDGHVALTQVDRRGRDAAGGHLALLARSVPKPDPAD
jgi:hypothetical protein